MKNKIIFVLFLFLSLNAIAQNKKFSAEIGYPVSLNANQLNKVQGLADVSLKYRFADTESMTYGVSYTFDWLKPQDGDSYLIKGANQLFHHVDAFGEFKVVGAEKLHPFIGVGFTLLSQDTTHWVMSFEDPVFQTPEKEHRNNAGFNINFGGSYDISSHFFIQTYFHYIRTYDAFLGKNIGLNNNILKIGAGFRF